MNALEDFSLSNKSSKPPTPPVLLELVSRLQDLDMEKALLDQYNSAITLRETLKHDMDTPVNQKAQVLNTITSILERITSNRKILYDAERQKTLETILIDTLKMLPKEAQDRFMLAYSTSLREALSD